MFRCHICVVAWACLSKDVIYVYLASVDTQFHILKSVFSYHHSAASSNELLYLHATQTQAGEVRRGARFSGHWVVTSMFA